ncbi:photoreceptor cilium actin regulator [Chanos chanos]|uniref:Photoreceptor cilium actin regulator n=1 Tax=Chanos chanos TaxID=29144 RepID=A0A6J2WGR4_CHACN|nr:photoreceptor cilium actin regulator [Chanos chanos]
MGCSPSKGNNFSGSQGPFRRGRTLLPGTQESTGELQSDKCEDGCSGSGETVGEKTLTDLWDCNISTSRRKHSLTESTAETASDKLGTGEIKIDVISQSKEKQGEKKQDAFDKKGAKKSKKGTKGIKQNKKKGKTDSATAEKVDFPEPLVKAHQAAYAYLNPSISKYEVLLSLLDQAAQTQISLQPMIAFLALRYEEINKGLEEMVDEGEKFLKENGEHLAWTSHMKNLSSSSAAKNGSFSTAAEPPPDLLQQLLQYTIQRMQLVGKSVSGIGDSALEEAVDYFSSVSEALETKLKAKRASEARLMQLLTRIEAASLRKPGPEDSTLFSEDSGIGAESESLAGSERQRNRRESCESTGTNRTTPCSPRHQSTSRYRSVKKMSTSSSLNSIYSTCTTTTKGHQDTDSLTGSASLDDGEGEEEEEEEVEEAEANQENGCNKIIRKQSNSSLPDPCQQPRRLPAKRIENPQNVEMTLKMKNALSGRIRFVPSQSLSIKVKQPISPKTNGQHWTEEEEKTLKRPQTAGVRTPKKKTSVTKQCRSRSADSLRTKTEDPTLLELERTQQELTKKLEKMNKMTSEGNIRKGSSKQDHGQNIQATPPSPIRRPHPLNRSLSPLIKQEKNNRIIRQASEEKKEKRAEEEEKKEKKEEQNFVNGLLKATPPPSPPPSPHQSSGLYRGRNSVKKLIVTFSQGVEESKKGVESTKMLGPLKGVRKCGVPIIPGLCGEIPSCNENNDSSNSQRQSRTFERTEYLDLESLPPPPLEVLMDNSFESAQTNETEEGLVKRGRSATPKRTTMSQRLRASMQSVTVLPSKGNLRQSSVSMSPARSTRQDNNVAAKGSHLNTRKTDQESEEAATLYKQARKIIHLRHSTESPTEKCNAETRPSKSAPICGSTASKQRGNSPPEVVPSTSVVSSQPNEVLSTSRIRMLPSTPVLHRRLPSPPVFKRQPTSPTSSSPPTFRKLPTPPTNSQRTLPSTPATKSEVTPAPKPVYPFKAPSPPASPKVHRWSRENSSEDSSSKVFSNARSVFCPASSSLFEAHPLPVPRPPQRWTSTGGCVLPRPWGDHGRLPVSVRGPQPFVRRSLSDRRPSLSVPPKAPVVSIAQTCGSEPALSTQGLEDYQAREEEAWNSQSELKATSRSASHPDLCIVGQALQRE